MTRYTRDCSIKSQLPNFTLQFVNHFIEVTKKLTNPTPYLSL
jgi:hypothetical protein